jgi:dipeptide/tripeptide permease
MHALRWLGIALLIWGLFTGLAYVMTPFLTDHRWGDDRTTAVGAGLIVVCAVALLRVGPNFGSHR